MTTAPSLGGASAPSSGDDELPEGERRLLRVGWAVAIAVVVLTIGWPLLGRGVLHAADLTLAWPPWSAGAPEGFEPSNRWPSDTVDGALPNRHEFAQRARDLDFAVRSPHTAGGQVIGGWPNQGSLSPLNLPYLLAPIDWAPALNKALQMAVAMFGMWGLARSLRLSPWAGLVGAVAYANTGFLVLWSNWPQSNVAALIPLLFWVVDDAVTRPRRRAVVATAVVTALMMFEGFPLVVFYSGLALAPFALFRGWSFGGSLVEGIRRSVAVGAGMALGLVVAAVQLVPFALLLDGLQTGSRAQNEGSRLAVEHLLTMVAPYAYGGHQWWLPAFNPVEAISFVGAGVVALAALGAVVRTRAGRSATLPLLATLVVLAIPTYGGGPLLSLLHELPIFRSNPIGRTRVIIAFILVVLAMVGVDWVLGRSRPLDQRTRRLTAIGLGGAALVAFGVVLRSMEIVAPLGRRTDLAKSIGWAALVGGLVIAAALLARRRRPLAPLAVLGIVAVIAAESIWFGRGWMSRIDESEFYPETAVHSFLADHLGADRFVATGQTMLPGSNAYYGLRSATGHTFHQPEWADMLRASDPNAFLSATYSIIRPELSHLQAPSLDRLAVRYVVAPEGATPYGVVEGRPTPTTNAVATPDQPVALTPIAPGGLRGVVVRLADAPVLTGPFSWVRVELTDTSGAVVASARRRIRTTDTGEHAVAIAGEDLASAGPLQATLHLEADPGSSAVFEATDDATASAALVRPAGDGLRLVHDEDGTVYERLTALPRVRFASRALSAPIGDESLALTLASDPAVAVLDADAPDDALLIADDDRPMTQQASLRLGRDDGDVVDVLVDSERGGLVVVADSALRGWQATIDGGSAPVVRVDHALIGVAVPGGDHRVTFEYRAPRQRWGGLVSLAAIGGCLALSVGGGLRREDDEPLSLSAQLRRPR